MNQAQPSAGASLNPPLILINGCFHTVDREQPQASAVAIQDGRFLAVGDTDYVMRHRRDGSQVIDLNGRTVVPGDRKSVV